MSGSLYICRCLKAYVGTLETKSGQDGVGVPPVISSYQHQKGNAATSGEPKDWAGGMVLTVLIKFSLTTWQGVNNEGKKRSGSKKIKIKYFAGTEGIGKKIERKQMMHLLPPSTHYANVP